MAMISPKQLFDVQLPSQMVRSNKVLNEERRRRCLYIERLPDHDHVALLLGYRFKGRVVTLIEFQGRESLTTAGRGEWRSAFIAVAKALAHLHKHGLTHGAVTALSVMKFRKTWVLTGYDSVGREDPEEDVRALGEMIDWVTQEIQDPEVEGLKQGGSAADAVRVLEEKFDD